MLDRYFYKIDSRYEHYARERMCICGFITNSAKEWDNHLNEKGAHYHYLWLK